MEAVGITIYKEESPFRKLLKKIFRAFLKKDYILVIDETNLMLPEAKEEKKKDEIIEPKKEEKKEVQNEELNNAEKEEIKVEAFDAYMAFEDAINDRISIKELNEEQIFLLMNILNEKLCIKYKKLDKKIKLIESKM